MEKISSTTDSSLNIQSMLSNQIDIVRAIASAPAVLAEFINYHGDTPIQFKGATVHIPPVPFIPYNNGNFCCLLSKIQGGYSDEEACRTLTVNPLGPRGKVGIPYIINSDTGEKMIVKVSKIDQLYARYDLSPPTPITELDTLAAKLCISDVKISNIRYMACDEFTNETLIAYMFNYMLSQSRLPALFVRHYQGAVCSNPNTGEMFGLNIMENCDLGSLDRLPSHPDFKSNVQDYEIADFGRTITFSLIDEGIIKQILSQLVVGLHMLQKNFGFVSGDLKAANVLVKSDPIDAKYMGIKLKALFTCKIADYGKSSAMIKRVNGTALRFYNENTLSNAYLRIHPFAPDITEENGIFYYTIGRIFTSQIYTRTRHMGVPFYQSFDYYTILVSILMIPSFYYMFFASPELRKIFWNPIWASSDEADEILKRIRQYVMEGKGQSIADAVNVLRGIRLKCSAINDVIAAWN